MRHYAEFARMIIYYDCIYYVFNTMPYLLRHNTMSMRNSLERIWK